MSISWLQTSVSYGGRATAADGRVFRFTLGTVSGIDWWWSAESVDSMRDRRGWASSQADAEKACEDALAELVAPKRRRSA